jgi:formylglycine-generating enzyme required for sulfatase activity
VINIDSWYFVLKGEIIAMKKSFLFILISLLAVNLSCGKKARAPQAPSAGEYIPNSPPREPKNISFAVIPGGIFLMGDVENFGGARGEDEKPVHSVMITGFRISVTEITNAQYVQYLNEALETGDIAVVGSSVKGSKGPYRGGEYLFLAGSIEHLYPGNRCWIAFENEKFSVTSGKEKWPVVYVTWYGARAYARHYMCDLPTEAEWEYACRSGERQYMFGTSDGAISHARANYSPDGEPAGQPVSVGSYPPTPFHLSDISGNVWEWTLDRYGPYSGRSVNDPTGARSGIFRVLRGGSWNLFAYHCRAADRNIDVAPGKADYLGFRVVRRIAP